MASAVTGVLLQVGLIGARYRDAAEAAGALRAGVDAFPRHGPMPSRIGSPGTSRVRVGWPAWRGQRAEALAAADPRSRAEPSGSTQTAADRWPAQPAPCHETSS